MKHVLGDIWVGLKDLFVWVVLKDMFVAIADLFVGIAKVLGRMILVILGASAAGAVVGAVATLFSETPSDFWVGGIIGGGAGFALSLVVLFMWINRDYW